MIRLPLLLALLMPVLALSAGPAAAMGLRLLGRRHDAVHGVPRVLKVNKPVAHRDHVHIGMTKRGAAALTSFWSQGR